jgi:hypothetical protein
VRAFRSVFGLAWHDPNLAAFKGDNHPHAWPHVAAPFMAQHARRAAPVTVRVGLQSDCGADRWERARHGCKLKPVVLMLTAGG